MKILVIGNRGQVAQALQERGRQASDDIVCLGRPQLDATSKPSIVSAIEGVRPDLVINAAAYTAVDAAETDEAAAFTLNRDMPAQLSELTAERDIPLIHISTDYVFDGLSQQPYRESNPVAPSGVYGCSKLEGELAVAAGNPAHFILRTAWVYSPFGKNFIKTMLRLAEERDTVSVVADQFGNPTSAFDIADGILAVAHQADQRLYGVYHMAGTGDASWADLAEHVFAVSLAHGGPTANVKRITTAEYPTPARRPASSRLNCDKFKSVFKTTLPAWQDSVRDVTARLAKEGLVLQ